MASVYLERWIRAGGIKTHYITSGNGEAVILLHGAAAGFSAIHNWRNSMGPLAEAGFCVYALEIVGFGLTDKPEDGNTFEAKVQHVKDFIDVLCLDKVNLVGNSMGGRISLEVALDWPERVRRMVLMGSGGIRMEPTPSFRQLFSYTPSKEKMKQIVESFCYDPSLVTDEMVELKYQMSLLPGAQEAYGAFMKKLSDREYIARSYLGDKLPNIKTPTLLIWGKQDRILPLEQGEKMASLLPNARLEIIDRCGHWVEFEHSQMFNRMVSDFFKS